MPEPLSQSVIDQIQQSSLEPDSLITDIGNHQHLDSVSNLLLVRFWQVQNNLSSEYKPVFAFIKTKDPISERIRKQADTLGFLGPLTNYWIRVLDQGADEKIFPKKKFPEHESFKLHQKLNVLLSGELTSNGELVGLYPTLLRLYCSWTPSGVFATADISKPTKALQENVEMFVALSREMSYWSRVLALMTPLTS